MTLRSSRRGGTQTEAGLELELAVLDRCQAAGAELAGWKVAFSTGRARDAMGQGFRPFGYILRSHVFRSGESAATGPSTL